MPLSGKHLFCTHSAFKNDVTSTSWGFNSRYYAQHSKQVKANAQRVFMLPNFIPRKRSSGIPSLSARRNVLREKIVFGCSTEIPAIRLTVKDLASDHSPPWSSQHLIKRPFRSLLSLTQLEHLWLKWNRASQRSTLIYTGQNSSSKEKLFTTQQGSVSATALRLLNTLPSQKRLHQRYTKVLQQPLTRLQCCLRELDDTLPQSGWQKRIACALRPTIDAGLLALALLNSEDVVLPLPLPGEHALWEDDGHHAYASDTTTLASAAHPPSQWNHILIDGQVTSCIADAEFLPLVKGAAARLNIPCYVLLPDLSVVVSAAQYEHIQTMDCYYVDRSLQMAYIHQRVAYKTHKQKLATFCQPADASCVKYPSRSLVVFAYHRPAVRRSLQILPEAYAMSSTDLQQGANRLPQLLQLDDTDHLLSCLPFQHQGFSVDALQGCIQATAQLMFLDITVCKDYDQLQATFWDTLAGQHREDQHPITVLFLTELQARCLYKALWKGDAGERQRNYYRNAANQIRHVVIYRSSPFENDRVVPFPYGATRGIAERRRRRRAKAALAQREEHIKNAPCTLLVPAGVSGRGHQTSVISTSLLEMFRSRSRVPIRQLCLKWQELIHPDGSVHQILNFLPIGSALYSSIKSKHQNTSQTRSKPYKATHWRLLDGIKARTGVTNELCLSTSEHDVVKTGYRVTERCGAFRFQGYVQDKALERRERQFQKQRQRRIRLGPNGHPIRNASPGLPHAYVPKLKQQPKFWACYHKKRRYWPKWL